MIRKKEKLKWLKTYYNQNKKIEKFKIKSTKIKNKSNIYIY